MMPEDTTVTKKEAKEKAGTCPNCGGVLDLDGECNDPYCKGDEEKDDPVEEETL